MITDHIMYTFDPLKSYQITPDIYNELNQVEFIRKVNNQRIYTIHKTDSNGLFYSFFIGEDISKSTILHDTVYVCKKLNKKDFNNIKIGDAISEIEQINPATTMWKDLATEQELETFEENVLLTDGLLVISYKKDSNAIYRVTDTQYHEDFKVTKTFYDEYDVEYDYSILSQDYPN